MNIIYARALVSMDWWHLPTFQYQLSRSVSGNMPSSPAISEFPTWQLSVNHRDYYAIRRNLLGATPHSNLNSKYNTVTVFEAKKWVHKRLQHCSSEQPGRVPQFSWSMNCPPVLSPSARPPYAETWLYLKGSECSKSILSIYLIDLKELQAVKTVFSLYLFTSFVKNNS